MKRRRRRPHRLGRNQSHCSSTPTRYEALVTRPRVVVVGVRPEHVHLNDDGAPGEVVVVEELGSEAYIHVKIVSGATDELLVVRVEGETAIERGDVVRLSAPDKVHVFDPSGDRLDDVV